ncbi:MAG: hypothetical protein COA43_13920 [Robiginitomaculum sp.]|nr:MAG: hypothetical protein COA43_13920 [Robiginitomaculum sp.]
MRLKTISLAAMLTVLTSVNAFAGIDNFKAGTAIPQYGKIAHVETQHPLSTRTKFKIAYDVNTRTNTGKLSRNLETAARFINMHEAVGIKRKNIKLAIVIHGGAVRDVTQADYYTRTLGKGETESENLNADLVKALIDYGVDIYVCGQSAAYYDVQNKDLLPGVTMALSAMTVHAQLQQKGYTLNPF